jgi:COP9 signalosome complex subunit 1
VRDIISLIQTRAVVQYVAPFSTVKIETMSKAFNMDPRGMLFEVEQLARDGRIQGRIDLIDGVSLCRAGTEARS